jgi:Spy/CpxP family protein refolding chaperone
MVITPRLIVSRDLLLTLMKPAMPAWILPKHCLPLTKALLTSMAGLALLTQTSPLAWAGDMNPQPIKWSQLNLNDQQEQTLSSLDAHWRQTYTTLAPQIQDDKQTLRQMLGSSNVDEQKIMALQNRIQQNEQRLRLEATRTFVQKCKQLSPDQRERIQHMMDSTR